jgi:hypothetical protein
MFFENRLEPLSKRFFCFFGVSVRIMTFHGIVTFLG